jgi:hypothetical protein
MTDQKPMTQAEAVNQSHLIQAALQAPGIRLYANGFMVAQTASDITVALLTNGQPNGSLSLSYISAKSLSAQLMTIVESFERATGQKIMTITEVGEALKKAQGAGIDVSKL